MKKIQSLLIVGIGTFLYFKFLHYIWLNMTTQFNDDILTVIGIVVYVVFVLPLLFILCRKINHSSSS